MNEWITDGSIPDHMEFVLVVVGREVWVAYWGGSDWQFNDGPPARKELVSAWMELPKPPGGKHV